MYVWLVHVHLVYLSEYVLKSSCVLWMDASLKVYIVHVSKRYTQDYGSGVFI